MCRISVMCIEIYGFIPHLAVWGMTRVSTSFVLGALPKMLKCRGGGMTTRPYIYVNLYMVKKYVCRPGRMYVCMHACT